MTSVRKTIIYFFVVAALPLFWDSASTTAEAGNVPDPFDCFKLTSEGRRYCLDSWNGQCFWCSSPLGIGVCVLKKVVDDIASKIPFVTCKHDGKKTVLEGEEDQGEMLVVEE